MKRTIALAAALTMGLTVSACSGSDGDSGEDTSGDEDTSARTAETTEVGEVTVGSANFPGNVLLAEIYSAALEDVGVEVEQRLNIGNRETYIAGLDDGSIDVIPEYTGALTTYFDPDAEATAPEEVYAELQAALPESLTVLEPAAAEDKDAIVVTEESAEELSLATIADLEPVAGELVLGGPPEWEERYTGVPGLREVYGLEFSAFRPLAAGSRLTAQALESDQIQVANIFSTDPSIVENGFVVLGDPENLFVAQNIVPLVTTEVTNETVTGALNAVSANLDTTELADLLARVVLEGDDSSDVAQEFVDSL